MSLPGFSLFNFLLFFDTSPNTSFSFDLLCNLCSPHRADGLLKAKSDLEAALKSAPTDSLVLSELKSVKQRLQEDGSTPTTTTATSSGQTKTGSTAKPTPAAADERARGGNDSKASGVAAMPKRLPNNANAHDDDEEKEADAQLKAGFRKALHAGSGGSKSSGKSGSGSSGGLLGDTRSDQVPSTTRGDVGVHHYDHHSGDGGTPFTSPSHNMSSEEAAIRAEDARRRAEAAAIAAAEEQEDDDEKWLAAQAASGATVSGYRTRPDGVKVPAWSRSENDSSSGSSGSSGNGNGNSGCGSIGINSSGSGSSAPVRLPVAAPQKLPSASSTDLSSPAQGNPSASTSSSVTSAAASSSGVSGSGGSTFNRGYRERDMTSWCVAVLLRDVLSGELAFKLPNCEGTLTLKDEGQSSTTDRRMVHK